MSDDIFIKKYKLKYFEKKQISFLDKFFKGHFFKVSGYKFFR